MKRQVIEDSYPELCKKFLQIKKKKTNPWSELQKPNCSTRPIMKISRTMSYSSNLTFILHRSNLLHLVAFYYILFVFLSIYWRLHGYIFSLVQLSVFCGVYGWGMSFVFKYSVEAFDTLQQKCRNLSLFSDRSFS